MNQLNLKAVLSVSLMTIAFSAKSQWIPSWYPAGFAAMGSDAIVKDAVPWAVGGNKVPMPMSFPGANNYRIGTTDGSPFELMSNGTEMLHIDQQARVAIGANFLPSVSNCVVDIQGTGSNFRIYGDGDGNVESNTDLKLHYGSNTNGLTYRFEINQGTPGGGPTPRMAIDPFGDAHFYNKMKVYDRVLIAPAASPWTLANVNARLFLDGTASGMTGLNITSSNGNNAISVANAAGAGRFRLWINSGGGDDTKCHVSGSTQIGFFNSIGMVDATSRLNVEAYGGNLNGVKVSTDNLLKSMLFVEYYNFNAGTYTKNFEVKGNGATYIGPGRPSNAGSSVTANAMCSIDGLLLVKDIRVAIAPTTHWADYVFDKSYKPMPLSEVEKFVRENHHLPEVPSEAEIKADGIDVTGMNVVLLKKIEELYLYTIDLKKQNDKLGQQVEKLMKDQEERSH